MTKQQSKARFFSVRKAKFGHFLMFGFGVGWDKADPSVALMLIIGNYILMIGPHCPIENSSQ